MRTSGYVVVLVIVGALAATPWVDGYYFKNNYTELLTSLSADNPNKIKVVDYKLGWLSSEATLSIDLNPPQAKTSDSAYIVTVNQHITHGPFAKNPMTNSLVLTEAVLQSQFHLDKKTESRVIGTAAPDGIVQVDTLASFNGHYQNQIKTPLFTVKVSDTGKLTWQGVTGNIDASFANNQLKHVKSDLSLGALAVQDATSNLSVPSMSVQADRDCQKSVLCSGTSELSVPNVTGLNSNANVKIVGVTMKSTYGVDANNVYSANLDFEMAKSTLPNYFVGPVSATFAMNNVNADSLSRLLDISKSATETSGEDKQSAAFLLLAEYNKELPHLVLANTVINQDMKINTSYGNFMSTAKFYWPANTPLPQSSQDFIKMNFKVDMRAATTLVNQVVSAIDAMRGKNEASASAAVTPAATVAPTPPPPPVPVDHVKVILSPYIGTGPKNIPVGVIDTLETLGKQHLDKNIYNESVDKIIMIQHLPKPVLMQIAQQLKDQYAATYTDSDTVLATDTAVAPAPDAAAANAPQPAASAPDASGVQLKQELDALIKQGFIKQDKDDYTVSIVYDGTSMQINGVTIPLPIPSAAASPSAQ